MKDKQLLIIEQAMKLFATKGVTSTSVQEIASESGISKGAFYLYFESKEALLLAIFKHYYTQIQSHIHTLWSEDLPPREVFIRQLQSQYEEIVKHKEFIIMHIRENALPYNQDMAEMMELIRHESFEFFDRHLTQLYGERIKPYRMDLLIILQGIIQSFLQIMILGQLTLCSRTVAEYTLRRLDDLVEGLEQTGEEPLITINERSPLLCFDMLAHDTKQAKDSTDALALTLKEQLSFLQQDDKREHERITLEIILDEIKQGSPRLPLLQGMLHNLENKPEYKELLLRISKLYGLS